MIRSMTGFGRGIYKDDNLCVTAEIKSVNHRYFEFSCRLPRVYQFLEDKLKAVCQQSISRGKIELSVFVEETGEDSTAVEVNYPYVKAYISALGELSKKFKIKNDIKASAFVGNPDAFKVSKNTLSDEVITEAVITAVNEAVENFIKMRETEGERLKADVISKADNILNMVAFVEERSPETVKNYRERLEQKMRELLADTSVDEQRIITETAVFADKVAVDEETVRLRSHIAQLKELLESDGPIGKKLDFIVQEMNREANTTGSKAQDAEITHTVVDIKSEIEKIREQIQNIE